MKRSRAKVGVRSRSALLVPGLLGEELGGLWGPPHCLHTWRLQAGPQCRQQPGPGQSYLRAGPFWDAAPFMSLLVITTYFFLCRCQNTTINLSHSLKAKHG